MDLELYNKVLDKLYTYTKGNSHLRIGDSFCCLGVICDLSNLGTWTTIHREGIQSYTLFDDLSRIPYTNYLPPDVQNEIGFRNSTGLFNIDDLSEDAATRVREVLNVSTEITEYSVTLAEINDHTRDFALIAEILEQRPESLFKPAVEVV